MTVLPALALSLLPYGAPSAERIIVLGFDGADARLTDRYLEEGILPHLRRLRDEGAYFHFGTTNPAQSPVSWACANTGTNPGKTNVFDFVRRINADPRTGRALPGPRPQYALLEPATVPAGDVLPIDPAHAGRYAALAAVLFFVIGWGGSRLLRFPRAIQVVAGLAPAVLAAGAVWKVCGWIPRSLPAATNPVKSAPFWDALGRAGIRFVGLGVPMTFPVPEIPNTRVLAGLGVPDWREGPGTWFLYSTDETDSFDGPPQGRDTETGGIVFRVDEREGRIETVLPGPKNVWKIESLRERADALRSRLDSAGNPDLRYDLEDEIARVDAEVRDLSVDRVSVPVSIRIDREAGAAEVTIDGTTQRLARGAWSGFYRVKFRLNPILRLSALVRVRLLEMGEIFRLYVEPLNLDPADPPPQIPIAYPLSYAKELAREIGPFETLGWACATNPLKDEPDSHFDDQAFLEDIERIQKSREDMLRYEMGRRDWRVLYAVFGEPDRVQHMMFRHLDPKNPLHRAEKAERPLRFHGREIRAQEAIREIYREMDRIVGETVERAGADATVIVVSDHGFSSFRKGVNINNWLHEAGYLVVKDAEGSGTRVELRDLLDAGGLFGYVDWDRTRAYSLGLGNIYLNVRERETKGIVDPAERESVAEEIGKAFESYRDPETGERVVRKVYRRDDIFRGPHAANGPDLVVGFEEGYRVSWQTTLGGIDLQEGPDGGAPRGAVLVPNDQNWSGDHCSLDPSIVPGIFFSNRRFAPPPGDESAEVLHLGPTILSLAGVPVPDAMDRAPLVLSR